MSNYAAVRSRYLDDSVATASPGTLLVMLYDRLVRDLERAEAALEADRRDLAAPQLTHAQDIVSELAATLDRSAWEGAEQLASVYAYLGTRLVEANVEGDITKVIECRSLVEPLHDAWKQAAEQVAQAAPERAMGELGTV